MKLNKQQRCELSVSGSLEIMSGWEDEDDDGSSGFSQRRFFIIIIDNNITED
ncbi:hypothetical protein F2P79_024165 [Pimephales promelas]|nr:hypothetical protein F2P79_024165 [Pimephales promelas]